MEAERKLDVLLAIRAKDLKDMEEEYCKKIIREVKRFAFIFRTMSRNGRIFLSELCRIGMTGEVSVHNCERCKMVRSLLAVDNIRLFGSFFL